MLIEMTDLEVARELVVQQLNTRAFAEHPEDRDDLLDKQRILDFYISNHISGLTAPLAYWGWDTRS